MRVKEVAVQVEKAAVQLGEAAAQSEEELADEEAAVQAWLVDVARLGRGTF